MERLLLLEDDLALGEGVRLALQSPSRPVTLCRDLAQARQTLAGDGPFALAILDVNLPDGSGLSLLEELRGRVPVILLTANDLETDVVAGLELGAEDYITKRHIVKSSATLSENGLQRVRASPGIYGDED